MDEPSEGIVFRGCLRPCFPRLVPHVILNHSSTNPDPTNPVPGRAAAVGCFHMITTSVFYPEFELRQPPVEFVFRIVDMRLPQLKFLKKKRKI